MSKQLQFNFQRRLSRRTMLRGGGAALALPWLSAMRSSFAAAADEEPPRRFVAMTLALGLYADYLFFKEAGRGYQPSRYLAGIDDLREQFTIVSGSSPPGVSGGHRAEAVVLSPAP